MNRLRWAAVIIFALGTFGASGVAHGQAVATISGTVLDATGASISGAEITAHNAGTGQERVVNADSEGHYVINLLPIGNYKVSISENGFQTVQSSITLEVGQSIVLDFKMVLASVSTKVEVRAEFPQVEVNRTNAEISQVIHNEQVADLPLNGRDFAQLAWLGTGTVKQERPGNFLNSGGTSEVSFRGSVALSSQGMRENANDWLYDGVDDNELTAGGVGFLPSIDAISEFKVMTYNFSAQYGSRAGTTVVVSSKAGSNTVHGSAFEFLRNDALDSRGYFDGPQKAKYIQNEYGASVGGPIKKDKTFFFLDFQVNSVRQGLTILNTVPTALERAGNFTESFPNAPALPIYDAQTPGRPQFISGGVLNVIPANRINPIAQTLLNMLPLPTVPNSISNNYRSTPVKTLDDAQWDARLDHQFGRDDHIFARFSWDNANQYLPDGLPDFGSPGSFNSNQSFTTHARNVAISETHLFSPTLVNQFTAGYNRDFNYILSFGYLSNESQKLGIPGANLGTPATSGLTNMTITGFAGFGDRGFSPFQGGTNVYHYLDSLNWVHGKHSVTFGGEFRAMQENTLGDSFFAGSFAFNKNWTASSGAGTGGNAVASFLVGLPASGSRNDELNGLIRGRRWKEYREFVEDNWTLSKQLSLQLGFAYAVTTPVTEAQNRFANRDFATNKIYVAGQGGGSNVGVQTDWSNVEPRIGFAFSPSKFQNTVVRGGYGIYHDIGATGGTTGPYENPPYANAYSFTSDNNTLTTTRTLSQGFPPNNTVQDPATYIGTWHSIATNFRQGLVQQWNLDIQQQIHKSVIFTIAYTGTRGTRLSQKNVDLNSAPPNPSGVDLPVLRPISTFGQILETYSGGWLGYQSMQAKVEKRTTKGLYILAAYTYSKALSNGLRQEITGDPGVNYYPFHPFPDADKGLASTDLRNNFTLSFLYNLPFGSGQKYMSDLHGPAQVILGGWSVNGITVLHSGFALGETMATNQSGVATGNRPNIVPNCAPLANPTPTQWFNLACFSAPAPGVLGNARRSYLYGPGQANLDLSFYKTFAITERVNLQFRSEFFNILNHTQFGTPATAFGTSTFGTITTLVNSPRQIQFALKLLF